MKSDKRRTVYHELVGSSKEFLTKSVKLNKTELTEFLEPCGINQDSVLNAMTHAVLEKSSKLLNVHDIGFGMYDFFYIDRLLGGVTTWAPLKRKQLNIFGTYTKTFNVRLKDRIIKLKEERGLVTKLFVLSRTRPNIDLPALFTITPRVYYNPTSTLCVRWYTPPHDRQICSPQSS